MADTAPPPSSWSAKELKAWLGARGVDYSGCLEKSELVALVDKHPDTNKRPGAVPAQQQQQQQQQAQAQAQTQGQPQQFAGAGGRAPIEIADETAFLAHVESGLKICAEFYVASSPAAQQTAMLMLQLAPAYASVDLVRVDLDAVPRLRSRYKVSVAPSFLYFRKGEKVAEVRDGDMQRMQQLLYQLSISGDDAANKAKGGGGGGGDGGGGGGGGDKPAAKAKARGKPGKPCETEYYDLLEIDAGESDESKIRKGYMRAARKWHPDKNPDNPDAEARFKQVSEAYNVLKDKEKRDVYDIHGRDRVQDDQAGQDPTALFSTLFGAGAFDETFGEVTIFGMMDAAQEAAGLETQEEKAARQAEKDEREREKIAALRVHLEQRIAPFTSGEMNEKKFKESMKSVADELLEAPGGPELLVAIGYVYEQEGKQHMGRFLGIEGFFAEVAETGHQVSTVVSIAKSLASMQNRARQLEQNEANAQVQQEMMREGINIMWKMGKFEIEQVLRKVCEATFDKTLPKKEIETRARAVKLIGEVFSKKAEVAVKEAKKQGKNNVDAFTQHIKEVEEKHRPPPE